MNNFRSFAMLCLIFAFLLAGGAVTAKGKDKGDVGPRTDTAQEGGLPKGFDDPVAWNKLDLDLQNAYTDAVNAGDMNRRLDCFVRDQNNINSGDKDFLMSNGFNIRTVGGTLASGYLKASDLPQVAGLPFIVSVKMAK